MKTDRSLTQINVAMVNLLLSLSKMSIQSTDRRFDRPLFTEAVNRLRSFELFKIEEQKCLSYTVKYECCLLNLTDNVLGCTIVYRLQKFTLLTSEDTKNYNFTT